MTDASADPTMEFLNSLDDPNEWVIKHNVPICIPHERTVKNADGEEYTIVVTEEDLPAIAEQLEQRAQMYGVLPVITIGHRQQSDPNYPERLQPGIVGVTRNHAVGTFGPSNIPCVLGSTYIRKRHADEAKEYPFRSMDFYPNSKKVTGLALLKRDPYLPMGMVSYYDDQEIVQALTYSGAAFMSPTNGFIPGSKKTSYAQANSESKPTSNIRPEGGKMAEEKDEKAEKKKDETPAKEAAEGEAPPDMTGGEPGAPEGHEEWLKHFDHAAQHGTHPAIQYMAQCYADDQAQKQAAQQQQLGPDGQPLPPPVTPTGVAADEGGAPPPPPAMPMPGEQNAGGDLETSKGLGQSLIPGWDMAKHLGEGKVSTAIGDLTRAKGVHAMQGSAKPTAYQGSKPMPANEIPVAYQVAIDRMNKRLDGLEAANKDKDAKIAKLERDKALADSELQVYQLATRVGIVDLDKPEVYQGLVNELSELTEDQRKKRVEEIRVKWAKDPNVPYAMQGAPVGPMIPVAYGNTNLPSPLSGEKQAAKLDEAKLKIATDYQKKNPGKSWDECRQYALTGEKPVAA